MWKVILHKNVQRRLAKISNPDRDRIKQAIRDLEDKHETLDIKPLTGQDNYRLRVGDWRLLMDIYEDEKIFYVYMLASRGDVYKK